MLFCNCECDCEFFIIVDIVWGFCYGGLNVVVFEKNKWIVSKVRW